MGTEDCFDSKLFTMTTITIASVTKDGKKYSSQGSAFYYNEQSPAEPGKTGPQWYRLDKHWLVTNRHVVLPKIDNVECVPDEFVFCLRENDNGVIKWKPITLSKDELLANLKLHSQNNVDVALVDITSHIQNIISDIAAKKGKSIMLPTALSNLNLPENQPMQIEVASDIIVASYPKGFYDSENKFPIVKSGIVASAWGCYFNGLPIFQIDAQLFPGSSGGLVISKPTNTAMIDGTLKMSQTKQFVLLGVYSGEYTWDREIVVDGKKCTINSSYGLGNVWYSHLIPEIITNGVSYTI